MTALADRVAVVTGASMGSVRVWPRCLPPRARLRSSPIWLTTTRSPACSQRPGGAGRPPGKRAGAGGGRHSPPGRGGGWDEYGPVDVLVNNAGYAVWKPLEETTIAEWDRTFAR